MLPPRSLLFPAESIEWAHLPRLLDRLTAQSTACVTTLHMHLGYAPSPDCFLLMFQISSPSDLTRWIDLLHDHHQHALLVLRSIDELPSHVLRDLPGFGIYPIFQSADHTALIDQSPSQVEHQLTRIKSHSPYPIRMLAPRANSLQLAMDKLLLNTLTTHHIEHIFLEETHPPLSLLNTGKIAQSTCRYHVVTQHDKASFLTSWLNGSTLATLRSTTNSLTKKLTKTAYKKIFM